MSQVPLYATLRCLAGVLRPRGGGLRPYGLLTGFLPEDKGPYALTPNTVELIPALGALFPRGGPVQDPVLTGGGGRGVAGPPSLRTGSNRLFHFLDLYWRSRRVVHIKAI